MEDNCRRHLSSIIDMVCKLNFFQIDYLKMNSKLTLVRSESHSMDLLLVTLLAFIISVFL